MRIICENDSDLMLLQFMNVCADRYLVLHKDVYKVNLMYEETLRLCKNIQKFIEKTVGEKKDHYDFVYQRNEWLYDESDKV